MKKILVLFLALFFLVGAVNVSASEYFGYSLPLTYNGVTYGDIVAQYLPSIDRTRVWWFNPISSSGACPGKLYVSNSFLYYGGSVDVHLQELQGDGTYGLNTQQSNVGLVIANYADDGYSSVIFNWDRYHTSLNVYDSDCVTVLENYEIESINSPPNAADHFTWPVDPQNSSSGQFGWCSDWRKDADGCYWLSDTSTDQATVWRDVQPFQLHYYHYQKISGYHLGADYNLASGDTDRGQFVYPASKGEISEVLENACGWGNIIFVRHDTSFGTYTSMYAHVDWLDSGKPNKGSSVDSTAPIAKVGIGSWNCGKNNKGGYAAHLHFELREGDSIVPGPAYTSSVVVKGPQGQIDPNAFISTYR